MAPASVLYLDSAVHVLVWAPFLFESIIPSFLVHVLVLLRGLGFLFLIQLFKLFSGNSLCSNGLGFDPYCRGWFGPWLEN